MFLSKILTNAAGFILFAILSAAIGELTVTEVKMAFLVALMLELCELLNLPAQQV